MHPVPGGWGYWFEIPQEPSLLKDHLLAKFHPNPSCRLDFFREQTDTDTQTDIALYVLDISVLIIVVGKYTHKSQNQSSILKYLVLPIGHP